MGTAQVQDEIKNMPDEGYSNPASLPVRFLYLPLSAWLLITFLLLVFLKTCLIFFYPNGPAVFFDELLYKEQAQQIFSGQVHYGRLYDWAYPPLYPVSLSLAFLSQEHWYEWMLFINTLLSSSIIFPAYLISKRLLPERVFFLPVIMVALLPFHAVYPSLLMSENLFLLVFLFALYFSLIREKRCWFSGMLVGVFCALAYMTKYLFLPSIPLLIGLWWLIPLIKQDLKGKSISQKLQLPDLAAVTAGFLVIYTPWLIYAQYIGMSVGKVMGLQFAGSYGKAISGAGFHFSGDAIKIPNLDSLGLWVTAYSSYLVLVLAPLLGILYLYFRLLFSKKEDISSREKLFFFSIIAFSIGYSLLAVQHSWGAGYNYPVPQYVIGRYLMHLTPLYFIAAVVALYRLSNHISYFKCSSIFIISLVALILVWAAQQILFEQAVWKLPGYFADSNFSAPDSFIYSRHVALWAVLSIIFLIGIILFVGCWNKEFNQPFMVQMIAGLLIFFQFSAFCAIYLRTMTHGVWRLHPRRLAPILNHDIANNVASIALMYDLPVPGLHKGVFSDSFVFWGVPHNRLSVLALGEKMQNIPNNAKQYFLSGTHYDNMHSLYSYNVDGKKYYLYETSWEKMRVPAPIIEGYGPRSTKAGRGFYIQPSGSSAIWLRTRYATSATVIIFNGQELETTVGSGVVTAVVPDKLFSKPGEYRIYLLDKAWGNKSNSVVFKVE
jgi:hypothetical protein